MRTTKYFKEISGELIDPVLLFRISKITKWHTWWFYGCDDELAIIEAQAWAYSYKLWHFTVLSKSCQNAYSCTGSHTWHRIRFFQQQDFPCCAITLKTSINALLSLLPTINLIRSTCKQFQHLTAFSQILDKPLLRRSFPTALQKHEVADRLQASVRDKVLYVSILQ